MSDGKMDGFVTGQVLQEEPVTPAQWLPQVWGPRRQAGGRREAGAHAAERLHDVAFALVDEPGAEVVG